MRVSTGKKTYESNDRSLSGVHRKRARELGYDTWTPRAGSTGKRTKPCQERVSEIISLPVIRERFIESVRAEVSRLPTLRLRLCGFDEASRSHATGEIHPIQRVAIGCNGVVILTCHAEHPVALEGWSGNLFPISVSPRVRCSLRKEWIEGFTPRRTVN